MALSIPDRVVVFDYGEVISMSQSEHDKLALLGAADAVAADFWPVYWRHRDDLDQGVLPVADYWRRIAADLRTEFSPSQIQRLWAIDFRSWISVEPGTVDLIQELHDGGTRLALLSNAGFDYADPLRRSPLGALFERVFLSAELGIIKPDPEIYRAVARELGVPLEALVFVDNKAVNVDAAVALGVTGHVFTGVPALRTFLERLADD